MDSMKEFAKMFKERDNIKMYSPMFGKITNLDELKISINEKITLQKKHITNCVENLYQKNVDSEYVNLGKMVVLLPYSNYQKYILIGVISSG